MDPDQDIQRQGSGGTRVIGKLRQTTWRLAGVVALMTSAAACAPAIGANQSASSPAPAGTAASAPQQRRVIDHLQPSRDSIGRAPVRFTWTAIEGADDYAIGVWNEVDQMIWRQTHITATSIDRPEEIRLEPGTYFWSVSALQGEQELADSGLAAFVVRTTP
jgi:hypothetical protein